MAEMKTDVATRNGIPLGFVGSSSNRSGLLPPTTSSSNKSFSARVYLITVARSRHLGIRYSGIRPS